MRKVLIIPEVDFSSMSFDKVELVTGVTISISRRGEVTLSAKDATSIYYTIDGSVPTKSSTLYALPFTVERGTTIKAIAVFADGTTSDVAIDIYNGVIPKGFKELEYLESTGTQWINTGILYYGTKDDEHVEIEFEPKKDADNFFGGGGASNMIRISAQSGTIRIKYGSNALIGGALIEGVNKAVVDEHKFYCNNKLTNNMSAFTLSTPRYLTLFGFSSDAAPTMTVAAAEAKIYRFSMIYNGFETELIPLLRESDNKPGMYDVINDVFKVNDGDGEFLYKVKE